jgi:hypothetical protein
MDASGAYARGSLDWAALRRRLAELAEGLADRAFRVVFVEEKPGGRSLAAAFAGRPAALPPPGTTGVVTTLSEGPAHVALVEYWSRDESAAHQRVLLDELGVSPSVHVADGPDAVAAIRDKLPPGKQELARSYLALVQAHQLFASRLGTVQTVPFEELPEDGLDARKLVETYPHLRFLVRLEENEPLLRAVKRVVLPVSAGGLPRGVEVVDLRGDPYVRRHFLARADAVVLDAAAEEAKVLGPLEDELLGRVFLARDPAEQKRTLLGPFRDERAKARLADAAQGLRDLASQLEASHRARWEQAKKDCESTSRQKVAGALRELTRLREGFREKSERFRKEQVFKKTFDKPFDQATARVVERLKTHLAGCTEAALRQEHETGGVPREPRELLRLFREKAQAAILDDYGRLLWDRGGGNGDLSGLLRKLVRDGYFEAVGKSELVAALGTLVPGDPEPVRELERVFHELDVALEVTTDNSVTRETLELHEPTDPLAQGAAGFPDWAKRYQNGLAQVLTERLQRCSRSMQQYLWGLYWRRLAIAEERVLALLASDELVSLLAVKLGGKEAEETASAVLAEHFAAWRRIEQALAGAPTA